MYRYLLAVVLPLAATPVFAQQPVDEIDTLTEQWIKLEKQTHQLNNEWKEQAPAMRQRIQLLKAEQAQLKAILAQSSNTQGDVEQQRDTLVAQQSEMEVQQEKVGRTLAVISTQVDSLYEQLPAPVQSQWEDEQAQLTEDANTSSLMQVTLAKLSSLQKFDQQLTVNETVITTPDNKEVLVKQLYLGAGYAWFTNADGRYQGYGNRTSGIWRWYFDGSIDFKAIQQAIAIYEKKQEPAFVELPVVIATQLSGVE